MKNARKLFVPFALLVSFGLSAFTANANQLASAKVLDITGIVNSYTIDGTEKPTGALGSTPSDAEINPTEKPLTIGKILKQDDSIVTTLRSSAQMVFSNGSELTVDQASSITFSELAQEAFSGNKSFEQLQADPSKSQVLLTLNYGKVSGHVKQLKEGSTFLIQTPLGTAVIRGTKFVVEIRFNLERGESVLFVNNLDGKVDVISRISGSFTFGRRNLADKGFEIDNPDKTKSIPAGHTVAIRLSIDDPKYSKIINQAKNRSPYKRAASKAVISAVISQLITPEDRDAVVASPNQALLK